MLRQTGAVVFGSQTLMLCLASLLVLSVGWAGGSQPSRYSQDLREQATATLTTRAYVRLIRAYRSGKSSDVVRDLATRETRDVRNAVARSAQSVQTAGEWLREVRAVEVRWRNGEIEHAKYGAIRSAALKRLEEAVKELGIDDSLAEEIDRLETDLQGLLRGAIGLHTAISEGAWHAGQDAGVADHLEFAKVFVRSLVARHADIDTGLWCKTAGMLLTASDRVGDALRTYEQCLEWHPGDAWLLLGRGSAFESAAMLLAALPPGATLVYGPNDSDIKQLSEQAIAQYEAALQASPELTEARIRLARMLLARGDATRAAAELAGDRPNLPTVLKYWELLIAGAIEEARDGYQKAAEDYRTALQLYPRAQSAAIALSRVLAERLGRREEALTTLRYSVSATVPRTISDDPWRFYRLGQVWRAVDWLREIAHWSRV